MVERLVLIALVASGCTVDVSLVGKRCSPQGTCPEGLVCRAATGTCESDESGTPAVDWTPSMTAVYLFESGTLGQDATPNGLALTERNSPEATVDAMQGASAAIIGADRRAGFDSADGAFAFAGDFTFGGWLVATSDLSSPNALAHRTMTEGYFVERNEAEATGTCLMEQEPAVGGSVGAAGSWPRDTWVHVVCRFRHVGSDAQVTTFVDAVAGDEGQGPWAVAPAGTDMGIAPSHDVFEGKIDELFFAPSALSATAVARIRACGIDGALCVCDQSAPQRYTICGRATDCAALSPCDQEAP